ncbi:MAG: hypothetical protein A2Z69_00205 [Bacteroidetes bacterium RBG_13_44_24]|nr:MAG: hypothetical protein A2Z69_00205 [Bacteroidetes bacterium RBG_13_44_24]
MAEENYLHGTESAVNLVRLHEKWMDFTEKRLDYLERRMNQIPWILFGVAINLIISLMALLAKYIK